MQHFPFTASIMKYIKFQLVFFLCTLFCSTRTYSQLPDCDHIYLKRAEGIYNYDPRQPVSGSNPVGNFLVDVQSNGYLGLTVSEVLGSGNPTLTFYAVDPRGMYVYYDPLTNDWVNTGHNTTAIGAVNITAGGPYIFNLVGAKGEVYRYDGKGDDVLIATVSDFTNGAPYDLVADCEGNWYILKLRTNTPFLRKYDANGVLLHSWVVHNPLGIKTLPSAGFAIIGTTLYTDNAEGSGGITVYSMGEDTVRVVDNISNPLLFVSDDFGCCAGNVPTRPAIKIKASKTSLCNGTEPVDFSTSILSGGPEPAYQWYVNGVPVGSGMPTYRYAPASGDKVFCVMTSNSPCASPLVVSSDTIIMVVYDGLPKPPKVSPLVLCKGTAASPLSATKAVAESKLYWYESATGGEPNLTPPTPSTASEGSFTYYVSEGNGDCESPRVPLVVTVTELIVSGENRGHPTSWAGTDGFIRFKTNQANEVFKIAYRKDNEPQAVLTVTSDASGYITIPGLEGGVYTEMTITNANACVIVYSEAIELGFCDGSRVPMPNSFTPNGDHINDVFYVRGSGFTVRRFYIYNRLGNLVFSKENFPPNDPQYGWDGKMNGKVISDTDGFVYMLETVCLGTNTPLLTKGTVLMIK